MNKTSLRNSDQIRVLEIISGFAVEGPLGGIERFGIELVQAFDKDSVEPVICGMWAYDTPTENQWVESLREKGIQAFIAANWQESSPYNSFLQAYKGTLANVVGSFDIIHSHCQFGDGLALLLKKKLGAKILVRTVHNEREWGKRPFRRAFLTGGVYPIKFDAELGVSQQVVDNLDKRLMAKFLNKPAIKAYNALNLERFNLIAVNVEEMKDSLELPQNALVIGTVGRLTEQKGYSFLIDAMPIVSERFSNAYLIIVGTGELEDTLKKQVFELGLNDRILFTGARDDVEKLLQIMDVFVNSSLWEGLPTVIMESMIANVPVIATNVSGNTELVYHGETGYLIESANSQQLADSIIDVLNTPQKRKLQICYQAKKHVEQNFSIKQVATQYSDIYTELLLGT